MTLKIFLLTSILTFTSACLMASPLLDSIGIENQDGKKVILHKLEPKDNYFSIGRRYNIKPNVIIQFNGNSSLRVGQIIKVPTEQYFVSATPQATVAASTTSTDNAAAVTEYKVSAGETLYAISRRFNIKVEDIISQNNLRSNNLTPGQILKIRSAAPTVAPLTPPPAVVQQNSVIPAAKRDSALVAQTDSTVTADRRLPANRYGITERNERGVATYMDDTGMGLDPNKKLVLHRTAPIGTVLKITNPMTNRTTFAKVVGSFTENAATKDVVIVLTKSAADALGALDKRFQVTISYGTPTTNE
jgi:LysM repeat protein